MFLPLKNCVFKEYIVIEKLYVISIYKVSNMPSMQYASKRHFAAQI